MDMTLESWRDIYNSYMFSVPNAATMTVAAAKEIFSNGNGYFVYRGDTLIGIGVASDGWIQAIIAVVPGMGADVLLALNCALSGADVYIEVASENHKAVALYNRLGFTKTETVATWYENILSVT